MHKQNMPPEIQTLGSVTVDTGTTVRSTRSSGLIQSVSAKTQQPRTPSRPIQLSSEIIGDKLTGGGERLH
jgi:hypothetical protein